MSAHRSIAPPFSKGLDMNGTEIFNFLFPDGSIFTAHWSSYALLALVLAVAVELCTRVLMLLSQVRFCTQCLILLGDQIVPVSGRIS